MKANITLFIVAFLGCLYLFKPFAADPNHHFHIDKTPQEYMTKVFVTTYNETGHIKNQLKADYWAYLPKQSESTLAFPHLVNFKSDGTEWHVDAKKGLAKQPTLGVIEQIKLWENVTLERKANEKNAPILVETETLSYRPKEQYVESDSLVKMTKPNVQITGTGLRAFLDQSSLELLHNVKTSYNTYDAAVN